MKDFYYVKSIKNKKTCVILLTTLCILAINFVFLNFFKLDDFITSDIVAEMNYIESVVKYKNLLSFNWINSQELFINRPILISLPIYLLTKDIVFSYKMTIVTAGFLLCFSFSYLLIQVNARIEGILIGNCFILSLWDPNASVTLLFLNSYILFPVTIILTIGFYIRVNIKHDYDNQYKIKAILLIIWSFFLGLSGPRMLLVLYIPIFLIEVLELLKSWKEEKNFKYEYSYIYNGITLFLANFVGLIIYKYIIINRIGHIDINTFGLLPLLNIIKNIVKNVSALFLSMNLNINYNLNIINLIYGISKIFVIFCFILSLYYILNNKVDRGRKYIIEVLTVSVMGVYFYLSITMNSFEIRYYFVSIYLLIIIIIFGTESIFLRKENKYIATVWLLILCILINFSVKILPYYKFEGNVKQKDTVTYLLNKGYDRVYASYWNASILKGLSDGKIDTGHFGGSFEPYMWLTDKSNYFDKYSEGDVIILLTDDEEQQFIERKDIDSIILNNMDKIKEIDDYNIYLCRKNPVVRPMLPRYLEETRVYDFSSRYAIYNVDKVNFKENYVLADEEGIINIQIPYDNLGESTYDFILNYELLNLEGDVAGEFEVISDNNESNHISNQIKKGFKQIEVNEVSLKSKKGIMECRIIINRGTVLRLKNIEIIRTK